MPVSSLERTYSPVNSYEQFDSLPWSVESASDEDLLRLCARRDNRALEELVRRYQPSLARLLSSLVSSPEDVEEALLNVFLRAWQYAPRFQYRAKVKTWLYRIATNIARDLYKQQQRHARQEDRQQTAADLPTRSVEAEALQRLERAAQAQALQRALSRLHPTDRLLLALYYYEQMDYPQMQEITQMSYTVLKTRLTRARRRLRQLLEEEDQETKR